jgi:hypothetical protein
VVRRDSWSKELLAEMMQRFPANLDNAVALDMESEVNCGSVIEKDR